MNNKLKKMVFKKRILLILGLIGVALINNLTDISKFFEISSYNQSVLDEQRRCFSEIKPKHQMLDINIQNLITYISTHPNIRYKNDETYLKKLSKTRSSALELLELLDNQSYLFQPLNETIALLNNAELNLKLPSQTGERRALQVWGDLIGLRRQLSLSRQKNPDCVKLI